MNEDSAENRKLFKPLFLKILSVTQCKATNGPPCFCKRGGYRGIKGQASKHKQSNTLREHYFELRAKIE